MQRLLTAAFIGGLAFLPGTAEAQLCAASNSWGCGGTYGYGGDIQSITIKNSSGVLASYSGLGCTGTANNKLVNAGSPIDITAGESITFELTGTSWTSGTTVWNTGVGVWVDANRDNSLSAAECIADANSGPFNNIVASPAKSATIKMPCWTSAGKSYLRFRGYWQGYTSGPTPSQGCGSYSTYGNVIDVEVNLKLGSPPIANFVVPTGPNYEKTKVTFNANNPNPGYVYKWTYQTPLTIYAATGPKGQASWNGPGTYDVKMLVDYCGLADSIIKQVKIVTPTKVPTAEFIASSNTVEQYYNVQLLDLSSDGAYQWAWTLTSPTGNVYTSSQQNPVFMLDEIGKWDVCLVATNGIGSSTKLCKSKYIDCTGPSEYYLGPNKEGNNQKGTLYDNGGPSAPYGANRKVTIDYFKILPCGATEIRLKFKSLKLADASDKLRIYDGADESGKLLTPAGGIDGSNQNTYRNQIFKAKSGAMYITFESNGSGQDSGIIAVWESDLAPPVLPNASWSTAYNPASNGVNVMFNNTSTNVQGAPTWEWIVGGSSVATSKDYSQAFYTDGTYDVCLVAGTCNGVDTSCSTITIVTPTAPGALDYVASQVRPPVLTPV
ncbi:MAG: hypothetical protein JNL57_05820, partial [Bacteroidetes bacterium]|nr:hypothetical protein [Bacteroidota bacterium]